MRQFFLDNDDDGHWYVVAAHCRREWYAWRNSAGEITPDFAYSIGCEPSRILFENPIEQA